MEERCVQSSCQHLGQRVLERLDDRPLRLIERNGNQARVSLELRSGVMQAAMEPWSSSMIAQLLPEEQNLLGMYGAESSSDRDSRIAFEKTVARALLDASADRGFRRKFASNERGPLAVVTLLRRSEHRDISSCCCVVLGRIARFCSKEILASACSALVVLLGSDCEIIQEVAAFCVGRIARHFESLGETIAECGGLSLLSAILAHSAGKLQQVVVEALRELVVFSDKNRILWVQNSGWFPILQLVMNSEDQLTKLHAAEILVSLACRKEVRRAIVDMSSVAALVEAARIGNMASKAGAAHAMGLLAFTKRIRRQLVEAGAIPVLIDMLRSGSTEAKHIAGNALAILAAHVDHLRLVAQAGAIELFADMVRDDDSLGKEIAEDAFCILAVYEENAVAIMQQLVALLRSPSLALRAAAADIIWDLTSYKHSTPVVRSSGAIPLLVALVKEENQEARDNASGALAQVSYDVNDRKAMAEAGAIPALVSLLGDQESEEARENAAEALLNFASDSSYEAEMTDAQAIRALLDLPQTLSWARRRETDDHAEASLGAVGLRIFGSAG